MNTVVEWYALSTVLLFLKMFATSLYQGFHRISKRAFVTPEDAALVGRPALTEELPQVRRASRAWLNDLENIPIFLASGAGYIWVEASPAAAAWLFPVFVAARYSHTLFYLAGMQPWRTIAYGVGISSQLAMCIQIIRTFF